MITIILVGGDTMPWGDRTGPSGMGPMTGRAAGYCAGYAMPGYATMMHGWGGGFGRRGGWGRRNRFYATGFTGWQRAARSGAHMGAVPYGMPSAAPVYPPFAPGVTKEDELNVLKGQTEYLEDALGEIQRRIAVLEQDTGEK